MLYIAAAVVIAVVAVAVLKFMTNPDLTNLTGKKLLCSASINTLRFKSVCVCLCVTEVGSLGGWTTVVTRDVIFVLIIECLQLHHENT